MIPPTDRRQPELTLSSGLLTGNCHLPVLCCHVLWHWSDLFTAQARVLVWRTWVTPLFQQWQDPTPKARQCTWSQVGCRSYRKVLCCKTSLVLDSTPDFLFIPPAFVLPMTSVRQESFFRVFLLCMTQVCGYMIPVAGCGPDLTWNDK